MKKILLLLFSLPVLALQAQVPGYMGLRGAIKYECGIMHPVFVGRQGKLPMVYNNLSLEYAIGRAWTAGLNYGFMTYNAPPDAKIYYSDAHGSTVDYSTDRYDHKGRYYQHTVGLVFKKFMKNKGYLAPVGRYWTLGIYYQYVATTIYTNLSATDDYTLKANHGVAHMPGLILGMGRQYVVADRILLDVGFNFNFALYKVKHPDINPAKASIFRELFGRNLFHVYLGFGVLAFKNK